MKYKEVLTGAVAFYKRALTRLQDPAIRAKFRRLLKSNEKQLDMAKKIKKPKVPPQVDTPTPCPPGYYRNSQGVCVKDVG